MSSIDQPEIIRKLIERKGNEPARMYKGLQLIDNGRRSTEQIWAYITGFGGPCYKLIYGLYPNGMSDEDAALIFLRTANIRPNTNPSCLYHSGKLTHAGKMWWIGLWGEETLPL